MKAPVFSIRVLLFLGVAALVMLPPLLRANDPSDPFDPANQAPVLGPVAKILVERIRFDLKVEPEKVKRGEVIHVSVTGKPNKGYFAYPINWKTPKQDSLIPTFKYSGIEGLKPLWPITETPDPHLAVSTDGNIVFHHEEPFTWTQDVLVDAQAKPGKYELTVVLDKIMICDNTSCTPPGAYRPLYASVEVLGDEPIVPAPGIAGRLEGPPAPKVVTPTKEQVEELKKKTPNVAALPGEVKGGVDPNNLASFLGFASLSAFLMLLTPCVFPMIPITVNFFIKQSEKEHHNPLLMASVYAGTIIVLLTTIMLALGSIVIDLANNTWFNLALGAVLIFFALSLFGMYEIELPHFLAQFTASREGRGGMVGTIFMAMTFTITSFTCTGPFLGLMLGSVAGVKPPMLNLALGAVIYSTTFAAPFFLLALFPSLLKQIPKSGSWLNSVKVTMGFLELGAALKFLSNADFDFFPGDPQLFNYDTILAAWIALSVFCSLYLLGLFRLPHDDKVESIGVIRMLIAVSFLSLAVYLAPALLGNHPAGVIGDNVVAFLPMRTGHDNEGAAGKGGAAPAGDHKDWYLDYEDAWKDAIANKKLILIDFTGVQCSNCRYNEKSVFPIPQVRKELSKYVVVSLYTDTVPNRKLTAAQAKEQAARNMQWQIELATNPALPTYLLFEPSPESAFEKGGVPRGTVVGKTAGAIRDVPGFVRLLQGATAKQIAQLNVAAK